jgi:hypothetical protein
MQSVMLSMMPGADMGCEMLVAGGWALLLSSV